MAVGDFRSSLAGAAFLARWLGRDDEIADVPGERRCPAAIAIAPIRVNFTGCGAPVLLAAIPQHFDRQIGGLLFQLMKAPNRAAPHDELDGFTPGGHEAFIGGWRAFRDGFSRIR